MGCSSDSREPVLWCDEPQRYCRRSKSISFWIWGDKCPLAVEMDDCMRWVRIMKPPLGLAKPIKDEHRDFHTSSVKPNQRKYGCVDDNIDYPEIQWRGQCSSRALNSKRTLSHKNVPLESEAEWVETLETTVFRDLQETEIGGAHLNAQSCA